MNDITIHNRTESLVGAASTGKRIEESDSNSFGRILQGSLAQVNRLQLEADASINDLASGNKTDIHQTMIAVEKAGVSFELLMQIRNKVISAYERIMRMPV